MKEPIIAGIDIGSAVTKTVIARVNDGQIDVIGIGEAESKGIRKGIIVNIDAATKSVIDSIVKAENMAGIRVPDIIATVNGEHIEGINSKGVIGVNTKNKEITSIEIDRVIDSAKNIHLAHDREIIESIEQEYSLDGQDEIKNPVGMSGTRLEADVHIITGLKYITDNLKKTLYKVKFTGRDIITAIRGSAESTLTQDEKDLGVALLDIGHSTTSLIVYIEGAVWHTSVIPIGGQHITNDIAAGLRVTNQTAELLKLDYGTAFIDLVSPKELIEVPTPNGQMRTIPKIVLTEIIQPRVEEILSLIGRELSKLNCVDLIASGLVFTGGGSQIQGLVELAEAYKITESSTSPAISIVGSRIGYPDKIVGIRDIANNPAYSAVIGILQMSMNEVENTNIKSSKKKPEKEGFASIFKKKNPFSEFFN